MRAIYEKYAEELDDLKASGNLRTLPSGLHEGRWILSGGQRMLNLSSNDYLGLASDTALIKEFREWLRDTGRQLPLSSSSSRLLTGNFGVFNALEDTLASLYGREEALVLSSGYHMNAGILPALCGKDTLILADKLVHASLIDGIRLSGARCIRYRHQDYGQLETLIEKEYSGCARCIRYRHQDYGQLETLIEKEYSGCDRIIIVTESIFSMDGDTAQLQRLTELKRRRDKIMLYVDEAHAVGVRGERGLGLAEETGCIADIDLLCGTFGKALASVRGDRLHRGHRPAVWHIRQGPGLSRSIRHLRPGNQGVSCQPDAHPHLHHRTASAQHGLDSVRHGTALWLQGAA